MVRYSRFIIHHDSGHTITLPNVAICDPFGLDHSQILSTSVYMWCKLIFYFFGVRPLWLSALHVLYTVLILEGQPYLVDMVLNSKLKVVSASTILGILWSTIIIDTLPTFFHKISLPYNCIAFCCCCIYRQNHDRLNKSIICFYLFIYIINNLSRFMCCLFDQLPNIYWRS